MSCDDICVLELVMLAAALEAIEKSSPLSLKKLFVVNDNMSAVEAVRKLRSKSPRLNRIISRLIKNTGIAEAEYIAAHIPGELNSTCDWL